MRDIGDDVIDTIIALGDTGSGIGSGVGGGIDVIDYIFPTVVDAYNEPNDYWGNDDGGEDVGGGGGSEGDCPQGRDENGDCPEVEEEDPPGDDPPPPPGGRTGPPVRGRTPPPAEEKTEGWTLAQKLAAAGIATVVIGGVGVLVWKATSKKKAA